MDNDYIPGKGWDEITYPFRNFNSCRDNDCPTFWIGCDCLSSMGLKLIYVSKGGPSGGVSLLCSVQTFKAIGQLKWVFWTNEIPRELSLKFVSDGNPILQQPHVWDILTRRGWNLVQYENMRPKRILNSNLAKSRWSITSVSVTQSFRNFAKSTAVSLPCSVQNFKTIG